VDTNLRYDDMKAAVLAHDELDRIHPELMPVPKDADDLAIMIGALVRVGFDAGIDGSITFQGLRLMWPEHFSKGEFAAHLQNYQNTFVWDGLSEMGKAAITKFDLVGLTMRPTDIMSYVAQGFRPTIHVLDITGASDEDLASFVGEHADMKMFIPTMITLVTGGEAVN
jgi:hypothetical protein